MVYFFEMERINLGNIQFVADAFLDEGIIIKKVDENGKATKDDLIVCQVYTRGEGKEKEVTGIDTRPIVKMPFCPVVFTTSYNPLVLSFEEEIITLSPNELIRQGDRLSGLELNVFLTYIKSS